MISHIIAYSILVTLQNREIISQKAEYKLKDFSFEITHYSVHYIYLHKYKSLTEFKKVLLVFFLLYNNKILSKTEILNVPSSF